MENNPSQNNQKVWVNANIIAIKFRNIKDRDNYCLDWKTIYINDFKIDYKISFYRKSDNNVIFHLSRIKWIKKNFLNNLQLFLIYILIYLNNYIRQIKINQKINFIKNWINFRVNISLGLINKIIKTIFNL